jgi:hypothetical protein
MEMNTKLTTLLVAAVLCFTPLVSHAQLATYTQTFESMNMADPNALLADGWNAYVNDFDGAHNYMYGYGFQAPNGGNAASAIVTGQGGAGQGLQQLSVYSNYNDNNSATGYVEMNVYKEQTIGAADVGKTVLFRFDAKHGNWAGAAHAPTAAAFIKTLNPAAGYATTHFVTTDMTTVPETWGTYAVTFTIDPTLVGQILQFGFMDTQTGYDPTVIFYDNILFAPDQAVPAGTTSWGKVKGMYR